MYYQTCYTAHQFQHYHHRSAILIRSVELHSLFVDVALLARVELSKAVGDDTVVLLLFSINSEKEKYLKLYIT